MINRKTRCNKEVVSSSFMDNIMYLEYFDWFRCTPCCTEKKIIFTEMFHSLRTIRKKLCSPQVGSRVPTVLCNRINASRHNCNKTIYIQTNTLMDVISKYLLILYVVGLHYFMLIKKREACAA